MNTFIEKVHDQVLRPNFHKLVMLVTMFFIILGLNLMGDNDDSFAQVNTSSPSSLSNNNQQTQESLGSTSRDAILSYEQGNKFLNAKNYDEAITSYKNAIKFDPNWAAPLIKQGNAFFELANYTTAIELYDKAFTILGNLDEKVKSVDKNNGPKPYWLDIWFDKGEALTNLKKFDDAIALYNKLISLDPNWANPWNSIGWALQKQGKNDEAVTAFDKATKLKPTWAKPWNSKGWALYKIGKFEEALFSFDKAIALEPKWDKPWFNKGKILYQLENYPDAKQFVEHALSLKADPKTSALLESINAKIQQTTTVP